MALFIVCLLRIEIISGQSYNHFPSAIHFIIVKHYFGRGANKRTPSESTPGRGRMGKRLPQENPDATSSLALPEGAEVQDRREWPKEKPEVSKKESGGNAPIDWAKSLLYWNVKNGVINFNNERDSDVFQEFELDPIIVALRNGPDESTVRQFHAKARNTMKKLTTELLIGHLFYSFDGRCSSHFFSMDKLLSVWAIFAVYLFRW